MTNFTFSSHWIIFTTSDENLNKIYQSSENALNNSLIYDKMILISDISRITHLTRYNRLSALQLPLYNYSLHRQIHNLVVSRS